MEFHFEIREGEVSRDLDHGPRVHAERPHDQDLAATIELFMMEGSGDYVVFHGSCWEDCRGVIVRLQHHMGGIVGSPYMVIEMVMTYLTNVAMDDIKRHQGLIMPYTHKQYPSVFFDEIVGIPLDFPSSDEPISFTNEELMKLFNLPSPRKEESTLAFLLQNRQNFPKVSMGPIMGVPFTFKTKDEKKDELAEELARMKKQNDDSMVRGLWYKDLPPKAIIHEEESKKPPEENDDCTPDTI